MHRNYHHSMLMLSLLTAMIIGCSSSEDAWPGEVTVEDGVTHVYNPATPLWGGAGPFLVEREVMGGLDMPEEQVFVSPFAVVVVRDGSRLILDGRGRCVHRYDSSGRWLGTFGRRGDGPGEFQDSSDMTLLPDGNVAITDILQMRITIFAPDGTFVSSRNLDRIVGQIKALDSDRLLVSAQPRAMVIRTLPGGQAADGGPALLDILNSDGEKAGSIGLPREYEGRMVGAWMNRVYPAVTTGDSVVVNYMGRPRMEVYAPDGTLARIVHRHQSWEPVEPTEEPFTTPDGRIRTRFEFDMLSTGMAVSPDGQFWAVGVAVTAPDRRPVDSREEAEAETVPQVWGIDIFDARGRWLARHTLGPEYAMLFLDWWDDGLYVLNAYGDATVRRLELTGNR
jgi:hypothetical protein